VVLVGELSEPAAGDDHGRRQNEWDHHDDHGDRCGGAARGAADDVPAKNADEQDSELSRVRLLGQELGDEGFAI